MSYLSTCSITREDAISQIRRAANNLEGRTDEELSEILTVLYGESTWHNFDIVPEYTGDGVVDYPEVRHKFD